MVISNAACEFIPRTPAARDESQCFHALGRWRLRGGRRLCRIAWASGPEGVTNRGEHQSPSPNAVNDYRRRGRVRVARRAPASSSRLSEHPAYVCSPPAGARRATLAGLQLLVEKRQQDFSALPGIQWEWNRSSGPSSFELGAAFEEWRCLRRPRAGGREFLHYHTHSKASSPLGLPEERRFAHKSAGRQSANRASTGTSPAGSIWKWRARVVQKPASTGASPDGELPWKFRSDWPKPPLLNSTPH